ncbi:hypothetical protein HYQ46_000065 [Verticillium longisporum]|nr:hypothetical protein HYQ46_000065 [Verticillium longisporum]
MLDISSSRGIKVAVKDRKLARLSSALTNTSDCVRRLWLVDCKSSLSVASFFSKSLQSQLFKIPSVGIPGALQLFLQLQKAADGSHSKCGEPQFPLPGDEVTPLSVQCNVEISHGNYTHEAVPAFTVRFPVSFYRPQHVTGVKCYKV